MTDEIVAALEAGVVPWHRPWSLSGGPTRMSNGKPYRGINIFILGYRAQAKGYTSKWWGTYKEIAKRGGQVRAGEKSTQIIHWRLVEKKDAAGEVISKFPVLNYFNVFNADQADGLDLDEGELRDHDAIDACEQIGDGYLARAGGLQLQHGGDEAAYSSMLDTFHEYAHSTGHESRLKREKSSGNPFGSPDYSKEELVAEMTAAFVCGEAGIDVNIPNRAAYIENWLQVFKGDKKLLVSAGGKAQSAADLILGPQDGAEDDGEES